MMVANKNAKRILLAGGFIGLWCIREIKCMGDELAKIKFSLSKELKEKFHISFLSKAHVFQWIIHAVKLIRRIIAPRSIASCHNEAQFFMVSKSPIQLDGDMTDNGDS